LQFLEGLHDRLSHAPVGLLGAAHDGELLARGDAFMAVVVVEAEAEQRGFRCFAGRGFLFLLRSHTVTVATGAGVSSGFSPRVSQIMSENASFCRIRNFPK